MFLFNEAISSLCLIEIPPAGKDPPLVEKLDWFFTSVSWTISYRNTSASSLVMEPSDHVPCIIDISTDIPKGKIFRFEYYWMEHECFLDVVSHVWSLLVDIPDKAKQLSAKFKNLRRVLKAWHSQLSSLKSNISNVKLILNLFDLIEEFRDLSIAEWKFRVLLKEKLSALLTQQQVYWKQRGTIKWVMFGDEGNKFFHANATIKHRRKLITSLQDTSGTECFVHLSKAKLLWESFRIRLGSTDSPFMHFNLQELLQRSDELGCLTEPFSHDEIDKVVQNLPHDKSPGPDGFNTDYVKKCWHIVKRDFLIYLKPFSLVKYVYRASMDPISHSSQKQMHPRKFLIIGQSHF
jgi:hypothetical protein